MEWRPTLSLLALTSWRLRPLQASTLAAASGADFLVIEALERGRRCGQSVLLPVNEGDGRLEQISTFSPVALRVVRTSRE